MMESQQHNLCIIKMTEINNLSVFHVEKTKHGDELCEPDFTHISKDSFMKHFSKQTLQTASL